jgi:hypothetical protein
MSGVEAARRAELTTVTRPQPGSNGRETYADRISVADTSNAEKLAFPADEVLLARLSRHRAARRRE